MARRARREGRERVGREAEARERVLSWLVCFSYEVGADDLRELSTITIIDYEANTVVYTVMIIVRYSIPLWPGL